MVACAIPRDDTKGVAVDRVAADAIILNALPSRPACAALAADTADATVTVCVLALDAAPLGGSGEAAAVAAAEAEAGDGDAAGAAAWLERCLP